MGKGTRLLLYKLTKDVSKQRRKVTLVINVKIGLGPHKTFNHILVMKF